MAVDLSAAGMMVVSSCSHDQVPPEQGIKFLIEVALGEMVFPNQCNVMSPLGVNG